MLEITDGHPSRDTKNKRTTHDQGNILVVNRRKIFRASLG